MGAFSKTLTTGFITLFLFCVGFGQPIQSYNVADIWGQVWMGESTNGILGSGTPPCQDNVVYGGQFPGGAGAQYLDMAALWIGAIIDSGGVLTTRVSTATDGWLNPSINEFWATTGDPVVERSRLDTVNCEGHSIYNASALSDHEFEMTFTDTLRNPLYVTDDPVDGGHHPLGLKVTRSVYSALVPSCNDVLWVKYHVENIGQNRLRNVYVGHMVLSGVGRSSDDQGYWADDLAGFEATRQIAYCVDNDGRNWGDDSSRNLTCPNILGMTFLRPPQSDLRLSFNWWISNGDADLDYGPSWSAYGERDSLGMGWTGSYGTPMGDLHKYQLMTNGELDFDQVYTNSPDWIAGHAQDGHAWKLPDCSHPAEVAYGSGVWYLLSEGPFGTRWQQNGSGEWIYKLDPGESFDCWMAMIGGRDFHNSEHVQHDHIIDPTLFNFADLLYRADIVESNLCVEWMGTPEAPASTPADFSLSPVYPNPFNSSAVVKFSVGRAERAEIAVYDLLGRQVTVLASGNFSPGEHSLTWNAKGLASGLYLVQARDENNIRHIQKAILLK